MSLEENDRTSVKEGSPSGVAYLLPLGESGGHLQNSPSPMWQGRFTFQQVPPGTYLVLAFDTPQEDLLNQNQEVLQSLASKGQIIHVEAGQKLNLKLKVNATEEE